MHREIHSISSRYIFSVWIFLFSGGFVLLALPAFIENFPFQWIYELIVLLVISLAFIFLIKKSRILYIYQFIGNEFVIRCQSGNKIHACAAVNTHHIKSLVRREDMPYEQRKKYNPLNLCGRPARKKDYYLIINSPKREKAILFQPSSRMVSLLKSKIEAV